jgi:dehydrogenase/reductase SDR family protein 12
MNIQRLVDDALEIAVVPSFSAIGYSVRRRLFGWTPPPGDALRDRTVLITGPTSGLGRAATDALAGLGARIVLVGRDRDGLTAVRDDLIRTHGADRFPTVVADMASLTSVRGAVRRVLDTEPRLDVVIDNAGAIFSERTESPDGFEATFATLVLGPFTLLAGLLPLLRSTDGARVVAVTSGGMYVQRLRLDDLQWEDAPFDGARAYAHAKRAQVVLVREWARRVPATEVVFNAMHPGWADTPGISAALPRFYGSMRPILRTPAEGADTTVWLASDPAAAGVTGRVFLDRRPRPFDRLPTTRVSGADRRRLWDVVVGLTNGPDPAPGQVPTRPHATHRTHQGATT